MRRFPLQVKAWKAMLLSISSHASRSDQHVVAASSLSFHPQYDNCRLQSWTLMTLKYSHKVHKNNRTQETVSDSLHDLAHFRHVDISRFCGIGYHNSLPKTRRGVSSTTQEHLSSFKRWRSFFLLCPVTGKYQKEQKNKRVKIHLSPETFTFRQERVCLHGLFLEQQREVHSRCVPNRRLHLLLFTKPKDVGQCNRGNKQHCLQHWGGSNWAPFEVEGIEANVTA